MKVIFTEDVPQVAYAGEVKNVADGYARNYLLRQKLAVLASPEALRRLDAQIKASAERRGRAEADMAELAKIIEGVTLTFKARVGGQERLYGSITNAHIADELQKTLGREFDKRRVELPEPLRTLGTHEVALRLSKNLTPKIKVVIEDEAPKKAGAAKEEVAPTEEMAQKQELTAETAPAEGTAQDVSGAATPS